MLQSLLHKHFFQFPDFLSIWASFRLCYSGQIHSGTLGPSLYYGTWYWFSSKILDKREHWPEEEQQIIIPIHKKLLLTHPIGPREIRSKDLSNPVTTEGSGWATWSSRVCPLPMAGGWNGMILKVPANLNHFLILWSTSWRFVFYL